MTKARDIAEFPKNLNIGEKTNLLTNGDFTTDTSDWAATGSSLAIVSNELQLTPNSGVNGFANQRVDNLVIGKSYIASVTVTVDAGNYSRLYIGTSANGNQTVTSSNLGTGTHSFTFVATATTHHFALVVGGGTGQVTRFDNARLTEANTITFPAISGTSPTIRQGTTVNDLAIATNNINRFNITNDGHVTMSSQPAFGARNTTNNSEWKGGSSVYVNIGNHYNNTTGVFTAPVAGNYYFFGGGQSSSAGAFYWGFYKNGTQIYSFYNAMSGYTYGHASLAAVVPMSANDTLQFKMAGSITMNTGGQNQFSGFLIG